jgi:hypothetical protein
MSALFVTKSVNATSKRRKKSVTSSVVDVVRMNRNPINPKTASQSPKAVGGRGYPIFSALSNESLMRDPPTPRSVKNKISGEYQVPIRFLSCCGLQNRAIMNHEVK